MISALIKLVTLSLCLCLQLLRYVMLRGAGNNYCNNQVQRQVVGLQVSVRNMEQVGLLCLSFVGLSHRSTSVVFHGSFGNKKMGELICVIKADVFHGKSFPSEIAKHVRL